MKILRIFYYPSRENSVVVPPKFFLKLKFIFMQKISNKYDIIEKDFYIKIDKIYKIEYI